MKSRVLQQQPDNLAKAKGSMATTVPSNQPESDPRASNQEKTKPRREGAQQPKSFPSHFLPLFLKPPEFNAVLAPPRGHFGLPSTASSLPNFGKAFEVLYQQKQTNTLSLSMGSIASPQKPILASLLVRIIDKDARGLAGRQGKQSSLGFWTQAASSAECVVFPHLVLPPHPKAPNPTLHS